MSSYFLDTTLAARAVGGHDAIDSLPGADIKTDENEQCKACNMQPWP